MFSQISLWSLIHHLEGVGSFVKTLEDTFDLVTAEGLELDSS